MAQDATPAVSSTADPHTSSDTLRALSADQRAEWRLTGKLPEASTTLVKADDADSAPAAADVPPVSTETPKPADSEPAADTPGKDLKSKERFETMSATAKTEKARADRLQAQLDAMMAHPAPKTDAPAAASSPATPEPKTAAFPDFATWSADAANADKVYEDYLDARTDARWNAKEAARVAAETVQRQTSTFQTRLDAAKTTIPDFEARVRAANPVLSAPMFDVIKKSDVGPELMIHLVEHPDDARRICALDPIDAIVEMGVLKAQIVSVRAPVKTDDAPAKELVLSKAPAVPDTAGSKPTVESDPVAAALNRKDFTAFKNAANAAEMAAAGYR